MVKNNITVAALRLFLLRGYKYVSIIDIANEVGITKGGIYHYFGSKEDLLHAAVQFLFDHLKKKFMDLFREERKICDILYSIIVDQSVDQYIKILIGIEKEDNLVNDGNFIHEVMQNFPHIHQRIDEDHLEICSAIEKKVHRAVEQGEIRGDLDTKGLGMIIWTMLQGQNLTRAFSKDRNVRRQIVNNFCKLLDVE
ncbi:MAG: ttgR [Firmicutes bacterium]|nr:ttgR [Bacillota bacterium]